MKTIKYLIAAVAAIATLSSAHAVVYTWTGATDGNWNTAGNWDGNGVPADTNGGTANLDLDATSDRIIFSSFGSNPVPTSNIPALGGNAFSNATQNTPLIDLRNGTLAFSAPGWGSQGLVHEDNEAWVSNVGDGNIGNGLASLSYTGPFSQALNRDGNGGMGWVVEADGALSINDTGSTLVISYDTGRAVNIILNGGSFVTDDSLDMLRGNVAYGNSYFDLTAAGSSVTAQFGADFAGLIDVQNRIGSGLTFRSTTAQTVSAMDNLDGSFTVSVAAVAIPEPSTTALLGLGGLVLILRRRK